MIRASLCAVAVTAFGVPMRALRRRRYAPKALFDFSNVYAAIRRICAARQAFFGLAPDSQRPPVFLIPGHKFHQLAKCFSVGHAFTLVPISEINCKAL